MIKDAEAHAEEDRKRRELIEARNQADTLIYSTEKNLQELGDKIDQATKDNINEKIQALRKAMEGDDVNAIKRAQDELMQAAHKVAEMMYQQAQAGAGAGGAAGAQASGGATTGSTGDSKKGGDDDVVDADFEEVK